MSSERNPVTNRSAWRPDEMDTDRSWSFTLDEVSVENTFAFQLGPGDVGFWNNYTTFHGRQGFAETNDESQKRVLLRVWLDLDSIRPFADEGRVRYGAIRHGQLGWTAEEVLSGRNLFPHTRHADGVPVAG